MQDVTSLDQYLARYGGLLGQQARKALAPLHIPSQHKPHVAGLLRAPFDPQAHAIAAAVKALQRNKSAWIIGECGTGKAQPLTSRVLTPHGYALLGDLVVGDPVVDPSTGGSGKVVGVFPQGRKQVFRIYFNDGTYARCCDDHLWSVTDQNSRHRKLPKMVLPLSKIRASIDRRYVIETTRPVQFHRPKPLPLDPYALGAFLGNGCTRSGMPVFSASDEEQAMEFSKCLPPGVEMRQKSGSVRDYSLACGGPRGAQDSNPFTKALRELGVFGLASHEKRIPSIYLTATVADRIALLNGLMDTDGTAGSFEFSTSSHALAADFTALVQGLGGTVRDVMRQPKFSYKGEQRTGKVSHRLYVKLPQDVPAFRCKRKSDAATLLKRRPPFKRVVNVVEDGFAECACIAVDTERNLYVTDNFIVTHNTLMGMAAAHTHAAGRAYRALVFCPPHLTGKWARELHETLPNVHTRIIESYRDLIELRARKKPDRPEWWITSNNKAKLGSPWKAAYITKPGADAEGLAYCPACMKLCVEEDKGEARLVPVKPSDLEKKRQNCFECKQPLWSYAGEIDRWPAADYIHGHLRGVFKYLIVDEVHQEKGADTAQANAMGALAAVIPNVLPLTGTLIGGYAEHLRTLMFRMAPVSLVEDGFEWSNHMPFNETYGRIETKIVEKESLGGKDNRYSKGSSRSKTKYVRPGVMPTLFGRHLIDKAIFLSLDEVAENLPELHEEVIPVYMDPELSYAYEEIQEPLLQAVKEMVRKGDKRLLGMMLQVLLCYPDLPNGWPMIGYQDTTPGGERNFVPVVQPRSLDTSIVRPKESELVQACVQRKRQGRQTWIFTTMTDKRDVCERLKGQLEAAGLKVQVLRASVETKKREAWIAKHGPSVDVVLSHPQLVETGLDLFDKGGAYNFSTLIFYLTGYNLFTLRQASRRAWRVGQREKCEVLYFYYAGTMQERAMELMGKKLAAAEAIEGKFSAEGLAAMAGEESSAEMALARSLINKLDRDESSIRAWNRVVQSGKRLEAAQTMVMEQAIVREDLAPIVVAPVRKQAVIVSRKKKPEPEAPRKLATIVSRKPRQPMPGTIQETQRDLFAEVRK